MYYIKYCSMSLICSSEIGVADALMYWKMYVRKFISFEYLFLTIENYMMLSSKKNYKRKIQNWFDYTAMDWKKIVAVLNEVQITHSVYLIDNNRIVICELHKQKIIRMKYVMWWNMQILGNLLAPLCFLILILRS